MSKSLQNIFWTLTAIVLLIFSNWLIKDDSASYVVNIIGCLVLMKQVMKLFGHGSKAGTFWQIVCTVAFIICILINLILLSI